MYPSYLTNTAFHSPFALPARKRLRLGSTTSSRRPLTVVHWFSPPSVTRHLRPVSHAGNGSSDQDPGPDDSKDVPRSPQIRIPPNPAIAKKRLLEIITSLINNDGQIQEAELLIRQLESATEYPVTQEFTEMAISGTWKLVFSSMHTTTKGNVRIRQIGQHVNTQEKLLINQTKWTFPDRNGIEQINASLDVECSYEFVTSFRLRIQLREHKVRLLPRKDGKPNKPPADMKRIITELQLALPREFFDPSGLMDVTYVDPTFRLSRFMGKKLAGVRNLFVRDL
ncbi:unnamed protein product [Agarophyton chilense]